MKILQEISPGAVQTIKDGPRGTRNVVGLEFATDIELLDLPWVSRVNFSGFPNTDEAAA